VFQDVQLFHDGTRRDFPAALRDVSLHSDAANVASFTCPEEWPEMSFHDALLASIDCDARLCPPLAGDHVETGAHTRFSEARGRGRLDEPRAYEREQGIMEAHLRPFFGTVKLADIRRVAVQRYITQRSGEVSPGSIVKELNVLKHLLALAVEWELIPANPAHRRQASTGSGGRVRYLQPTELRAVLKPARSGFARLRALPLQQGCGAVKSWGCAGWTLTSRVGGSCFHRRKR